VTEAIRQLFELLSKKEKSGSDYTGKVTRVNGNRAYVQFDGSEITDTPVLMSIGASPGDSVRVRVADGKAWLTGNDSAPPNDSSGVRKELEATNAHIDKLETENIVGENGWINLKEAKFDFGGGALSWNGKLMRVKGSIQAGSGKIGQWDIDDNGMVTREGYQLAQSYDVYRGSFYTEALSYARDKYNTSASANPYETTNASVQYESIFCRKNEYNSSGELTSSTMSELRPTAIKEANVYLSNKYAPISNSDPVLKKNIVKSSVKALDLIKHITMHAFDWKSNNKHWDVGFIAPELHGIDPNMAIPPTGENGSYWSVNSFYLVGVLTKAIQEQQQQIELLEEQLQNLETLCIERFNQ